jgi:hypothetical protein
VRAGVVGTILAGALLMGCSAGTSDSSTTSTAPTAGAASAMQADPSIPTGALPDDAVVTYDLRDSSVPPQFHRSVALTVTKGTSRIVIDSYGDVLADRTVPTPSAVWSALGSSLDEVERLRPSPPPQGCTGGTGRSVTVVTGPRTLVDVTAEFCGGSNPGLDEAMDAWVAPARMLFPPAQSLAPPDAG